MLDANEEYGLKSPTQEHPNTIWFNITVENIEETHQLAMENGCQEVQPITEMMEGALKIHCLLIRMGTCGCSTKSIKS